MNFCIIYFQSQKAHKLPYTCVQTFLNVSEVAHVCTTNPIAISLQQTEMFKPGKGTRH